MLKPDDVDSGTAVNFEHNKKEVSVFLDRERFSKCDSSFFRCFFTHI